MLQNVIIITIRVHYYIFGKCSLLETYSRYDLKKICNVAMFLIVDLQTIFMRNL
jgi:hypothetical protein